MGAMSYTVSGAAPPVRALTSAQVFATVGVNEKVDCDDEPASSAQSETPESPPCAASS